ncbi:MAG: NAD(P)-binding domain-containing protein [bacterium]|nr:NAD(P)-binding domain-containing protein [bacterium]
MSLNEKAPALAGNNGILHYMSLDTLINIAVGSMVLLIPIIYWLRFTAKTRRAELKLKETEERGLTEPISLHPKIDPNGCISTGACVSACPEGEILGLINGRATLVSPTKCIGHGACMLACPTNAISLVFGTEKRGVELPHVKETFETNVPGVYIAGELGGMGLIRNAVTQGREAVEYIAQEKSEASDCEFDLIVVGAGPAGMAASLCAQDKGLRTVVLEQEQLFGGAILSYPRQKLVMTQPMEIPTYGLFKKREIVKEELLDIWKEITDREKVDIRFGQKVDRIERDNSRFIAGSNGKAFSGGHVLLAIGRRGSPRKLGIPGEASSKVAYRLLEPEQYQNKSILVVGGGDSAIEAALVLSEQPGNDVSLSYRKAVFSRIKEKNEKKIKQAIDSGAVKAILESHVTEIHNDDVILQQRGEQLLFPNDYVFVMVGGEFPTQFLKSIGIEMETKYGVR